MVDRDLWKMRVGGIAVGVLIGVLIGGPSLYVRSTRVVGQGADVEVTITADNAYGFGWGTADAMTSYFGGVENRLAGEIFNCPLGNGPERYTIPGATVDDYLYIVGWSDDAVSQGVIGQFRVAGGKTIHTGAGDWQVYATGLNFDSYSGGPPLNGSADAINQQIALANGNSGGPPSTSGGWVDTAGGVGANAGSGLGLLAFGEDNRSAGGDFPRVCPSEIDDDARWMWFTRDGQTPAFRNGNHKEYLIFRLPVRAVIPTPEPPDVTRPDCVCQRVRRQVPAAVVDDALARPERYYGWRYLLDPNKPPGPNNPPRECLSLRNPNVPYHPIFNGPIWQVGCP